MRKIPWVGAMLFLIAALGNAWVIGALVQADFEGTWYLETFDLSTIYGATMMVESCLLAAWLVFGATPLVVRGTVVAASVAILAYLFHRLWATDSQFVRPDILTSLLVATLLVPRIGGWRVVKLAPEETSPSIGLTRQYNLRQLLMATLLVAIACSLLRYLLRTQSLPEIFLINLLLGVSLTVLSLYGTLACAKPVLGTPLVALLYVAITTALAMGCSWYQQVPYHSLMTDYNIRSMFLELTLALIPLLILRKSGYRLTIPAASPASIGQ